MTSIIVYRNMSLAGGKGRGMRALLSHACGAVVVGLWARLPWSGELTKGPLVPRERTHLSHPTICALNIHCKSISQHGRSQAMGPITLTPSVVWQASIQSQ